MISENKLRKTRELTRLRVRRFREIQNVAYESSKSSNESYVALTRNYNKRQYLIVPPENLWESQLSFVDESCIISMEVVGNQVFEHSEVNEAGENNITLADEEDIDEEEGEEEVTREQKIDEEYTDEKEESNEDRDEDAMNVEETDEEVMDINDGVEDVDDVEEIREWALLIPPIPHARLELLLRILKRQHYPDLPKSAKTFLGTTSANYSIGNLDESDNGEFVYFGITASLMSSINPQLHKDNCIHLIINIDGLPLFKSSSKQFWPILCKVYHQPDTYRPFPVAIYCGNHKPRNLGKYLEGFIREINELQDVGITIDKRLFEVSIKAFICDRPARAFIKCIKGHGGYWACERCTVRGKRIAGRTIYPIKECVQRTDDSFRSQSNPQHHNGLSPILAIKPRIDMIRQFVLDSMHLVYLGVMKKLLDYWLNGNLSVRLSQKAKKQLSNILSILQP